VATDRGSKVDEYLQRILQGSDFPAFARQMRETVALLDDDDASTQLVVNIILRDYSLTLNIIRAANSVFYNRTGRPIQSATHAMLLLGARNVRQIASTILLFEHYHGKSSGLKELMLLSLLNANHAREAAIRVRYNEPEEAHLGGMFGNLGEVLIAAHFPEDYAKILEQVDEKRTSAVAAFNVLGFRFEELGDAMAKHWGMPEAVLTAMRARTGTPTGPLAIVTAFSHDLTHAIYREGRDGAAVTDVIARYRERLGFTREEVCEIIEAGLRETREIFSDAGASLDDLKLRRQTDVALRALGVPRASSITPAGQGDSAVTVAELREQLLRELDACADAVNEFDLNKVLLLALETMLRGGPFDRVLLAVADTQRSELQGRFGLGPGIDALVQRFRFPIAERGSAISRALAKRDELLLFGDGIRSIDDKACLRAMGAAGLCLQPLVVDGKLIGALYVDRAAVDPAVDRLTVAFVRSVRRSATAAIERRRARASAPTPIRLTAVGKSEIVLRLLRGEAVDAVSRETGITTEELEAWRRDFLTGAVAALGGGGLGSARSE
jgi:HD-like signal output (HDOD) protein